VLTTIGSILLLLATILFSLEALWPAFALLSAGLWLISYST
jgi:hypothetical protein